jgi:hypothetical protein
MTTGFSKQAWTLLIVAGAAFSLTGGSARAQIMTEKYDLAKLTEKADSIMVVSCTKRETTFRDGNIVTRYTLKPSEVWKGTPGLNSAGEATLDQIGGQIDGPLSVGQLDTTSVELNEGQQVLLFAEAAPAAGPALASAPGASATAPATLARVVGGKLGAFSVIQDPETGEKLLSPGTMAGRIAQDKVQKALAAHKQQAQAKAKAAQAAKGAQKAAGAPSEAAQAAPAETINPFEDLTKVRDRVKQLMNSTSSK